MIKEGTYTLEELKAAIMESETKNEFKPKFGDGVESGNKKNNKKAVDDITKEVGKYNGKKMEHTVILPNDRNKTTIDLDFNELKPGKEWYDRVQAQAEGYPSVQNKKETDVKDNGGLEYGGNEEFYKHRDKLNKERKQVKKDDMDAGLKGRELKKYNVVNENAENHKNPNMKRIHFKKTVFLNEKQMLNHIPENFKTDGNRFYVKDASGTEYLLECTVDKEFNYPILNVLNKLNETKANNELDRMKQLFGYESEEHYTKHDKGVETSGKLYEDIEKVRNLSKED